MNHLKQLCALAVLFAQQAYGQFQPLEVPEYLTFETATPAFATDGSGRQLGDFQPNISVRVLEALPGLRQWVVVFERPAAVDIAARIAVPDLSRSVDPDLLRSLLDGFPLLEFLLATPDPWPDPVAALAQRLMPPEPSQETPGPYSSQLYFDAASDPWATVWGKTALTVKVDYRNAERKRIVMDIWNRGDAPDKRAQSLEILRTVQQRLEQLESLFETWQGSDARENSSESGITAVSVNTTSYFLPNDLEIRIRHQLGEFIHLEFLSFRQRDNASPTYDPVTFAKQLSANVRQHPEGFIWIDGIPMIDQGEKGYCAAATLARILRYYGYPVNMHEMADIAETDRLSGTHYKDVIASIRRVCSSTPFRIRQIEGSKRIHLLEQIRHGIPIFWLIPRHARLLIGVHPDGGVVYSDSYGPGHEFKTMSWDDFRNISRELWVLEP